MLSKSNGFRVFDAYKKYHKQQTPPMLWPPTVVPLCKIYGVRTNTHTNTHFLIPLSFTYSSYIHTHTHILSNTYRTMVVYYVVWWWCRRVVLCYHWMMCVAAVACPLVSVCVHSHMCIPICMSLARGCFSYVQYCCCSTKILNQGENEEYKKYIYI